MKKSLLCASALSIAFASVATVPVTEDNPVSGNLNVRKAARLDAPRASSDGQTFFEGFEDRPAGMGNSYDNWLPAGWFKESKADPPNTLPTDNSRHNLLWRITNNDDKYGLVNSLAAYEGTAFAYIINDVAYDGHYDLTYQDEWLYTPEITPVAGENGNDWLYFKLCYNAAWMVYNREANDFSGINNNLQVLISTDGGQTYTKLWDLIEDEIRVKYTDEELRASLIDGNPPYVSVFVDIRKYLGQTVKFAFRFYGSYGQAIAMDNVAVGVPMPVSKYAIPNGFLRQGVSPRIELPVEPRLLIPADAEAKWANYSEDVLINTWTYSDASGAQTESNDVTLTTPGYPFGSVVETPVLMGTFENRNSDPYQVAYTKMQVGGLLQGKDANSYEGEFGVGGYDVMDPEAKFAMSKLFALSPGVTQEWEKLLGVLPGTINVLGYVGLYPKPDEKYGFDYVDVPALVSDTQESLDQVAYGKLPEDLRLCASAYILDDYGWPRALAGRAYLELKDFGEPIEDNGTYRAYNLRFKFPVPVIVDNDVMIVLQDATTDPENPSANLSSGYITLYYMTSPNPDNYGNNLLMYSQYNSQTQTTDETFGTFNSLQFSNGHFAGFLFTLGASYAWMERVDEGDIEFAMEGGTKEIKVKAYHKPERWALTEDAVNAADWIKHEATYDAATETYTVKLTAIENPSANDRDTDVFLVSPGTYLPIHVKQPGNPAGIENIAADKAVNVTVNGGVIVVEGGQNVAEVFDVAGKAVASAAINGTRTEIAIDGLAAGVYVVRIDGTFSTKIVK